MEGGSGGSEVKSGRVWGGGGYEVKSSKVGGGGYLKEEKYDFLETALQI